MSKRQKWALAVMALVMILIIGAVVLIGFQNKLNDSRATYQQQIDAQLTQAP